MFKVGPVIASWRQNEEIRLPEDIVYQPAVNLSSSWLSISISLLANYFVIKKRCEYSYKCYCLLIPIYNGRSSLGFELDSTRPFLITVSVTPCAPYVNLKVSTYHCYFFMLFLLFWFLLLFPFCFVFWFGFSGGGRFFYLYDIVEGVSFFLGGGSFPGK